MSRCSALDCSQDRPLTFSIRSAIRQVAAARGWAPAGSRLASGVTIYSPIRSAV